MAIDFPNSPNVGDVHSDGGANWRWSGYAWRRIPDPGAKGEPGSNGDKGEIGQTGDEGDTECVNQQVNKTLACESGAATPPNRKKSILTHEKVDVFLEV